MSINSPVLMPLWMMIVAVLGLVLVAAWLLRSLLVTLRDRSREVGDIPMAPAERGQWSERVADAEARFAAARSGEDITTATVREILDISAERAPGDVEERLERVRRQRRPLDTNPLGHVGELLAVWEQPSFDRDPEAAAEEALSEAKEVVTRW